MTLSRYVENNLLGFAAKANARLSTRPQAMAPALHPAGAPGSVETWRRVGAKAAHVYFRALDNLEGPLNDAWGSGARPRGTGGGPAHPTPAHLGGAPRGGRPAFVPHPALSERSFRTLGGQVLFGGVVSGGLLALAVGLLAGRHAAAVTGYAVATASLVCACWVRASGVGDGLVSRLGQELAGYMALGSRGLLAVGSGVWALGQEFSLPFGPALPWSGR